MRTQRPGKAQTRVGPVCRSKRAGYASPPRFPRLRLGARLNEPCAALKYRCAMIAAS